MKDLEGQVTRAFLWDYGGGIAGIGVTFVLGVILARLLTPAEFGLVAMVMVFIGLAQGLMDVGLGVALIQRQEPEEVHYNSTFWLNVTLGVLLFFVTIAAAPVIAGFYGEPRLVELTRVLAVVFLFRSLTLVHEARFRKVLDFKTLTKVRLASSMTGGVFGVALAFAGYGVWSLVGQNLLAGAVTMAGVWFLSDWRPGTQVSRRALRELWSFGFPMFSAGILNTVFTRVDVLIVGKLFNAVELGFFTRAKSMVRLVVRFSSDSINRVMFPTLSAIQDQEARFREATLRTLSLVTFAALGLSAWMYVTSDALIVVLLTEKWRPAALPLQLFCLSAWGYPINSVVLSILKGKGHSGLFLKLEIVKKSLYFVALAVGFQWGIPGYLIGLAVVNLVNTSINIRASASYAGLAARLMVTSILPCGIAACAAAVAAGVVPVEGMRTATILVLQTGVVAASYGAATLILGGTGPKVAVSVLGRLFKRVDGE